MEGFPKCFSLNLHRTVSTSSAEIIFWGFKPAGMCADEPVTCTSSNQHAILCAAEFELFRGLFVFYHRLCLVRGTTLWCVLPMDVG